MGLGYYFICYWNCIRNYSNFGINFFGRIAGFLILLTFVSSCFVPYSRPICERWDEYDFFYSEKMFRETGHIQYCRVYTSPDKTITANYPYTEVCMTYKDTPADKQRYPDLVYIGRGYILSKKPENVRWPRRKLE